MLNELKGLKGYADIVERLIPSMITRLSKERIKIVRETANTFSDICSMIDRVNEGNEETTWDTCAKLCAFYKDNFDEDETRI